MHEKGLESRNAYTSRYANSLASKVRNTVDQPRTMLHSIRQSSKADRPVVTVLKLHVTGWPVYPFPTHTISPRLTRSHPKHLHQLPVKLPSSTTHCIHHRNRRKQSKVGCKIHRQSPPLCTSLEITSHIPYIYDNVTGRLAPAKLTTVFLRKDGILDFKSRDQHSST